MHNKINIFAEEDALVKLGANSEFVNGRLLKYILKNRANIFLILDEKQFETKWNDSESSIRKFFDAYDIRKLRAISGLNKIYSNPGLCYRLDPFAIWFFNKSTADLEKFRNFLGVWAINTSELTDNFFYINHSRGYDKNDIIEGAHENGWGNFLEQIPKPLPPINSMVLNDRHLINNTNENTAERFGFYGLNNLEILLDELLPHNLQIEFHILIYCQHPDLDIKTTDAIIKAFMDRVKALRSYTICIEMVFSVARHKRGLYTNYFLFDADRGFNAFYNTNKCVLCGENDISVVSYMSDPEASGETTYETARDKIKKISNACCDVYKKPKKNENDFEKIKRVKTECDEFFYNRLFS